MENPRPTGLQNAELTVSRKLETKSPPPSGASAPSPAPLLQSSPESRDRRHRTGHLAETQGGTFREAANTTLCSSAPAGSPATCEPSLIALLTVGPTPGELEAGSVPLRQGFSKQGSVTWNISATWKPSGKPARAWAPLQTRWMRRCGGGPAVWDSDAP